MNDDITRLKDEEKEKVIELSKEELTEQPAPTRQTRRAPQRNAQKNWTSGVILIAIGLIFLAANVTGFRLDNWWALFILIPAVANFGSAWADYQKNGRFTRSGRGSITGGLILTLVSFTFLFGWSWSIIWPIFLIIGGIAALLGGWFD
jgi:hypothetical protein